MWEDKSLAVSEKNFPKVVMVNRKQTWVFGFCLLHIMLEFLLNIKKTVMLTFSVFVVGIVISIYLAFYFFFKKGNTWFVS